MEKQTRLFVACIAALVATAFGFVVRGILLDDIGKEFALTEFQKGNIQGAGLFPFALSIIFFSLVIDKIGYGRAMVFAWCAHVVSAIVTITAHSYTQLFIGTFLFALANGTIEAVANPITATLYPKSKTHHLNILHSGWAGGLVLGGLITIAMASFGWRWKIGLFLVPTLIYGLMMLGQKFPVQERVTAGVSYSDMMKEFGWAGCWIVCAFICLAINVVAGVFNVHLLPVNHEFLWAAVYAIVPTIFFALTFRSFGQPIFIVLLFVMILSATTELGTNSWISSLMESAMTKAQYNPGWVLVYMSAIMVVLRLCAGAIVHRFSPLVMLATCSALAAGGLYWFAHAGASISVIFAAATMFGVGITFFWPTTLGVVAEQFPKGGAMTLNAIGGVGMISVGILGGPFLGATLDNSIDKQLAQNQPAIYQKIVDPAEQTQFGMTFHALDQVKQDALPPAEKDAAAESIGQIRQSTLSTFAIFPAIMFVCYIGLILYFKTKGGYKQVEIAGAPVPKPAGT